MTAKLRISPDLALPPDVVTATSIVYGGKGMGKTNFGSVLVEEMTKAGLRWCVLDPMGVWWGLRYSPDGKGPGIECVILGGVHGDIPIEPTSGSIVADLVVDEQVNTIIDFSRKADGKMWTVGERIRFVTDYTVRLFERQGSLVGGRRREPLIQILDEAARYIPQVIPSGAIDIAKCVGAWEQVCEEGRNIGLGVAFLTQRSARMNKSVSELADVMYAFRTVGPRSVEAVIDWLGEHVEKSRVKELAGQVRELNVGQALVVSPGWLKVEKLAQIRPRETFDSSATPKPGQQAKRVTGKAARPDLAAYEQRMAATIEKAKADDPKALRAEIAVLTKRLASAPVPTVDQTAVLAKINAAVAAERNAWARDLKRVVGKNLGVLAGAIDKAKTASARAEAALADVTAAFLALDGSLSPDGELTPGIGQHVVARAPAGYVPASTPRAAAASPRVQGTAATAADSSLSKGEKTILIAIAQYPDGAEREQLTVLTGYKRSSRDTYIQRLSSKRYVETVAGGTLVATPTGVDALGADYEPLPTGDALQAYWLDRLSGGEKKILEVLIAADGKPVARDQISEQTEYQRSSRDTYLQRLSSRRLVESVGRGEVRASATLFE
jgi:hypothetical protein